MLQTGNHINVDVCLICKNSTTPNIEVDKISYGFCNSCNHLQASTIPTQDFLATLYGSVETDYSSQDLAYVNISDSDLEARINEIAAPKVQFIKSNIEFQLDDLWLDIGSGTGDTLLAARDAGFKILGIEISPSEINLSNSRAVPTIAMFYDGSQKINQMKSAKIISIFNGLF